jgi:filamentous hemagglutinin family protein
MRSPLALLLATSLLAPAPVLANPKGGQVHSGSARISEGAGRVDVHQGSDSAVLSWDSFDIDPGEVTQFHQPGKDSVAINRIFQGDASQILGSLQANGHVYLINPHGILFGREAQVNVHALVATTTLDGGDLASQGFDPSAQAVDGAHIVNQGRIQSGTGGFVYLIAPYVRNGSDGVIVSPEGEVTIEAGATVLLTDRPDGRSFAVEYTAPGGGEAVNLGKVFADGGFARIRGELVTQGGLVQADSIRERDGVIELVAETELTLAEGSITRARGGVDADSHAGTIDAWSDGTARMEPGAVIDVSAHAAGGDGGFAELSAKETVEVAGSFAAGAGRGGQRGEILIDPEELVIDGAALFSGAGKVTLAADRTISVASGASIDLARQPNQGRTGRQELELRSGGDIVFERGALIEDSGAGKVWNVVLSAGENADGSRARVGDLVFEGGAGSGLRLARGSVRGVAAGDVVLGDGTAISSVTGDVDVEAGGDVVFEAGRSLGVDTVIESGSGDVRVVAEGSVLLQRTPGSGGNAAIRTRGVLGTDGEGRVTKTDGGDVLVWAKSGDVDAGVANRWVEPGPSFQANGPERPAFGVPAGPAFDPLPVVSPSNVGTNNGGNAGADGILGIGTEAGGSVVVIAGGDVKTHETPLIRSGGTAGGTGTSYDGAHIGAFGVPVYYDSEATSSLVHSGAVVLPDAPENRVIVIAGGDVSGDYMVRNGEATLLAGYALPAGVDTPAELAELGLDAPLSVEREQLRRDLDVSALAAGSAARGWVGTLADPITVDLVEGSVDMLGRNGVAVRTVENPSLVYPPVGGGRGTAKVPTYGPNDFALLEAETGDVVLLGNDAQLPDPANPGTRAVNPLVWLLPPSLTIRTNGAEGERPGDFVQLEDFLLYPSRTGGLELDVAGQVRTAGAVASNSATVGLTATTTGAAADLGFVIPAGTRLRDPETGLIYEVSVPISLGPRTEAVAGQVRVTFVAEAGSENREILIPGTTRVEDYNGLTYTAVADTRIPAPEFRQSVGEVRFVPEGGEARTPITVPPGTVMVTASGARFEVVGGAVLNPGDRAVNVSVRALPGSFGVDAQAGELRLEAPIAGLASATNRLATERPAEVEVSFIADAVGNSDRSDYGRIKTLLTPVEGARFAYAESPQGRGGSDPGTEGVLLNAPEARATVIGPVGEIRTPRVLEFVDPGALPAGVSAADVQVIATGTLRPAGLVPAVLRSPGPDGRPDFPTDTINVAESADIWRRTSPGSTARIKQSDAAPGLDARNIQNNFDYAVYFQSCRSGVECPAGITNPLDLGGAAPLKLGNGPTHRGDHDPASLRAGLGFFNFEFDLAEAATLRAGPAEGEAFGGTQADIVDVALITQHTNTADVTRVLAPYGDVLFAAEAREVIDEATGLPTTLAGNVLSGITVAGPGALQVQVGVTGNGAGATATGVGGRLGLSDVAVGDSSARGIETVGNLSNPSLGAGSASIDVVTAGNIELNDRGSIDTLQGGDIRLTSLGGALIGGQPEPSFTAKRGVFTLYVPGIGEQAAGSGGGSIFVDVSGDFDIGLSVAAALSGGDIVLRSRTGSISAGAADPFEIIGGNASPTANLPEVRYRGGGIFASDGAITIVAEKDVDIGAGITGGAIAIAAGGNINAGTGAISSSGNVSIDAGGTISGTIQASGAVSIGSGTVSQSASIAAGGLVVGAGSVGSNTGPGKVGAETAVASGSAVASEAAGQAALTGGQNRRSGVNVDVTSRPKDGSDDDEDEESDEG